MDISALQASWRGLHEPGATRCALAPGFHIPRLWRWHYYTSDSKANPLNGLCLFNAY